MPLFDLLALEAKAAHFLHGLLAGADKAVTKAEDIDKLVHKAFDIAHAFLRHSHTVAVKAAADAPPPDTDQAASL